MKANKFNKPILYPLYAAALTVLTFTLSLGFLGILGYGNDTILRSDLAGQYMNFIHIFLQVLKGEESLWYSFSSYLGSGMILTYAYYSINPLNLLYLIESVSIPEMTTLIILIKFALSAACFEFVVQKMIKNSGASSILFAMCYALSGYAVTMHYNLMWLDALYLLPIIIYLITKLIDKGSFLLLVPAYALLFITNFYMGFMVGVFSAVIFVLYALYRKDIRNKQERKELFLRCIQFAYAVFLAIGLCAAILLPTAYFLYSHIAEDNSGFEALRATLPDMINSMFLGQMQTLDTQVPLLYCGLPVLILLPFYFTNREIPRKEKIYVTISIVFLIVCMLLLPLYEFMHAFDYPNMYGYRFAFLLVFIFVFLACRELPYIKTIPFKTLAVYLAGLGIFYSFMINIQKITFSDLAHTNTQGEFILNAVFLLLWGSIFYYYTRKEQVSGRLYLIALLLLVSELSLNGYICISKEEHPAKSESSFNQWYYSEKEAIDSIKTKDSSFYRVHLNYEESYNAACLFGFNSFTTFSSSDDFPLRNALNHLGIATGNRFISDQGYTWITDLLFGAKYTVSVTPAEKAMESNDGIAFINKDNYIRATVTENPYALSLGYMVSPQIVNYQATADPFLNQQLLLYCLTGNVYECFTPIAIEDVLIQEENMSIVNTENYVNFYHYSDYFNGGMMSFSAPSIDGKEFLVCFTQSHPSADMDAPVIVAHNEGLNEHPRVSYGAIVQGQEANLYDIPTESVILYFFAGKEDYYCDDIFFYYYDNSLAAQAYDDLASGQLDIQEFRGDYIRGTVTVTEDRPVMLTSIPFDLSWHVYVDGKETYICPAVEDAFLSFVLEPGTHEVELEYIAKGSEEGLLISDITLILFILTGAIVYLRRKRAKKEKGEE